jgi:hypothetical protein
MRIEEYKNNGSIDPDYNIYFCKEINEYIIKKRPGLKKVTEKPITEKSSSEKPVSGLCPLASKKLEKPSLHANVSASVTENPLKKERLKIVI